MDELFSSSIIMRSSYRSQRNSWGQSKFSRWEKWVSAWRNCPPLWVIPLWVSPVNTKNQKHWEKTRSKQEKNTCADIKMLHLDSTQVTRSLSQVQSCQLEIDDLIKMLVVSILILATLFFRYFSIISKHSHGMGHTDVITTTLHRFEDCDVWKIKLPTEHKALRTICTISFNKY